MSNQEVANKLFFNTEAWEEISDIQGEAIKGGNPPSPEEILEKFTTIIGNIEERTGDKYDPARTYKILSQIGAPWLP